MGKNSKDMPTKQAFFFLMQERGIFNKLGYHRGTIGRMRHDIEHLDKYPTEETMESLLLKAGWKIKQEKLWNQ